MSNHITREFMAGGTVPALRDLEREGTYRAGTPLLSRPMFLTVEEHAGLAADTTALYELIAEVPDRLFDGDRARHAEVVGLGPLEHAAVVAGSDLPCAAIGRADYYRTAAGFRLLEFNVGNNIGGWDIGVVACRALADPALASLVAAHGLTHDDPRPAVLDVLFRIAGREDPVVGVLGAPGAHRPGLPYFPVLVEWFATLGIEAVGGNLGQVEDRSDGLHLHGRRLDVVYRMFTSDDVRHDPAMAGALEVLHRHAHAGTVTLHGPLTTEPAMSKANLALLSDPTNHPGLEDHQRDLVARTVPWTRLVGRGATDVHGDLKDLVDHVVDHQRELVLKPVLSFGGAGVVPGWAVSEGRWADAVATALREPHVVQERVTPEPEPFVDSDKVVDHVLNWGAFYIDGAYAGAMVRGLPDTAGSVVNQDTGARLAGVLHATREVGVDARSTMVNPSAPSGGHRT